LLADFLLDESFSLSLSHSLGLLLGTSCTSPSVIVFGVFTWRLERENGVGLNRGLDGTGVLSRANGRWYGEG
jgi:hypothetical protein